MAGSYNNKADILHIPVAPTPRESAGLLAPSTADKNQVPGSERDLP